MTVVIGRKPDLVSLCMFKGECYFKHHKFNGLTSGGNRHGWKKGLVLCTFDGTCNQKKIMNHVEASRLYGIPK